jgi:hypothetical protein
VVPLELEPVLEDVVVPELLELVVPASGGGGRQGPHTPSALPTGTRHEEPGQQSALTVHLPQTGTQEPPWKQMYGGVPPSIGFGTQGRSLQQLALEAQEPPGMTQLTAEQRGTPRES